MTAAANWIQQTISVGGIGDLTLGTSYRDGVTFAQAFGADASAIPYAIQAANSNYVEAGVADYVHATSTITNRVPTAVFNGTIYDDTSPSAVDISVGSIIRVSQSAEDYVKFFDHQANTSNPHGVTAVQTLADDTNFQNIAGTNVQAALDSVDDQLGGWVDGTTIADWGDTEQTLGSLAAGTSNVDLDNGHLVTAAITGNRTFNFTSTAGHTKTSWDMILATGGNTPTFEFGGVAIGLPDGYDVQDNATYWFTFRRTSVGVFLSERQMQ